MNEMKKGSRLGHLINKETADHELCSFYEQSSPLQLFFPEYISVIVYSNTHILLEHGTQMTLFLFVCTCSKKITKINGIMLLLMYTVFISFMIGGMINHQ